jgi:hypothetical protein
MKISNEENRLIYKRNGSECALKGVIGEGGSLGALK